MIERPYFATCDNRSRWGVKLNSSSRNSRKGNGEDYRQFESVHYTVLCLMGIDKGPMSEATRQAGPFYRNL